MFSPRMSSPVVIRSSFAVSSTIGKSRFLLDINCRADGPRLRDVVVSRSASDRKASLTKSELVMLRLESP